jgi:hypothetical protein
VGKASGIVLAIVGVVVMLAVTSFAAVTMTAYAQGNITYTTYTGEDLSFEYPEGWIVEEKTSRFDRGADITAHTSDFDNYQEIRIFKLVSVSASLSLKSIAEAQLEAELAPFGYGIDSENRLIEDIAINELQIDNEASATFLTAIYDKDTDEPNTANKFVVTKHAGQVYLFVYLGYPWEFDSPENTANRDHIFNSIKWID